MQNSLALEAAAKPPFPEQEQNLPCPRCDSTNTKFCYFNNYNLSQPRHFCKSCRRYWTKGGALRNIPVGGGTRKNSKRPNNSSASSASASNSKRPNSSKPPKSETVSTFFPPLDPDSYSLDVTGSFSALLASEVHFDNFLGGGGVDAVLLPNSSIRAQGMELLTSVGDASTPTAPLVQSFDRLEGDPGCWDAGWTDLAIYNPGSSMH